MERRKTSGLEKTQSVLWLLDEVGKYPGDVPAAVASFKERHSGVELTALDYAQAIETCITSKNSTLAKALPRAQALVKYALTQHPKTPILYVAMAHVFDKQGAPQQAKQAVGLALGAGPNDYSANFAAGMQATYAKQYPKAVGYFTTALTANPESLEALDYLSRVQLEGGNYADAARVSSTHLARDPQNSFAYFKLAFAQIKSHRLQDAFATLDPLLAAYFSQATPNVAADKEDVREALALQRHVALTDKELGGYQANLEKALAGNFITSEQCTQLSIRSRIAHEAAANIADMPLPTLKRLSMAYRSEDDRTISAGAAYR